MPSPPYRVVAALFVLQVLLLTIGISRDYQLKHEDNNALHAAFARSHLRAGLHTTRGENYFNRRADDSLVVYPNHPPGPGLVLAAVYGMTGHDGPVVTRATAIFFHVLGTWLFYCLARRLLASQRELVLAMLLYIVLPESAFFGRMLNHEVFVLPAALLLVRGYWEAAHGNWPRGRSTAAITIGAAVAAISGWAGYFAIAACTLHAAWERFARRNPRATAPLAALIISGAVMFAAVMGHLLWIIGGDVGYLRGLLASRQGTAVHDNLARWLGRILELHWRYFGLTSALGLMAVAYRAARRRRSAPLDPAQEVALIFLLAGTGYIAAFAFNATFHDYWQFLLLPASALGTVLFLRALTTAIHRPRLRNAALALVALDVIAATTVTLVQRHVKREGYCVTTVEQLRRDNF